MILGGKYITVQGQKVTFRQKSSSEMILYDRRWLQNLMLTPRIFRHLIILLTVLSETFNLSANSLQDPVAPLFARLFMY